LARFATAWVQPDTKVKSGYGARYGRVVLSVAMGIALN
jgi:hypothetical protein